LVVIEFHQEIYIRRKTRGALRSFSLTLTVTLLAALPWFVTSADVCIIALAATCETRPVAASATLFVSPMSVA
jgi:hypothetical protein